MESVQRTLDILEVFLKQEREVGVAEVAELTGINVTTVYRIMSDLVQRGYLRQKRKREKYAIGIKFLEYNAAVQQNLKIGEVAQPLLQRMSEESGEYVEIAVREGNAAVTIAQAEVARNLRISNMIGEKLPLHATSLGKVFLANMGLGERREYYETNELAPFTDATITNVKKLEMELVDVQERGYALDNEEFNVGVWSVAAPVKDYAGTLVASLALAAPSARILGKRQETFVSLVTSGARELSAEMGFRESESP